MTERDLNILVVEDNDFDVKRITRGFGKLGYDRPVIRARDGLDALEILRGEGARAKLSSPVVVLLDLNMPRLGGIEFLDELRADPTLCNTPVFVITTSDYHKDVRQAHERQVNGYFVKPTSSDEMVHVLRTLSDFWESCVYPE
ncbi:MAG: response regulator [Rhodobacteraceae bacterium]|nr:response regulator [Paracoccaceae bacterium]